MGLDILISVIVVVYIFIGTHFAVYVSYRGFFKKYKSNEERVAILFLSFVFLPFIIIKGVFFNIMDTLIKFRLWLENK